MNQALQTQIKDFMLDLLAKGGEYTRPQLVALSVPTSFGPYDPIRKYPKQAKMSAEFERLVVELDLDDLVSVRVAGDGTAYYSKAKPKADVPRVTYPTAFSKRGH